MHKSFCGSDPVHLRVQYCEILLTAHSFSSLTHHKHNFHPLSAKTFHLYKEELTACPHADELFQMVLHPLMPRYHPVPNRYEVLQNLTMA